MNYYMARELAMPFDAAVTATIEALKREGFGVLTDIDVQATLRQKLGVAFRKYRILGACHPPSAHRALRAEERIGLMLPCNVIVQERGPDRTEVAAIDPAASLMAIDNPALRDVGAESRVMRRLVLGFGLLACVLLASCSIAQRYPGAWPRVDPTRIAGCPPVAGDYLSDGVRADPFAAPSYLSGLVFERRAPRAILRVAQYGTDSLAIVAWKDGQAIARRVFSRAEGNLDCTREGVRLSCGWHSALKAVVPVLARRTLYLARATDGSLMVQDVEFSIAFLTLLPFPYKSLSWNRFSPPTFPLLPLPKGEPPMTE